MAARDSCTWMCDERKLCVVTLVCNSLHVFFLNKYCSTTFTVVTLSENAHPPWFCFSLIVLAIRVYLLPRGVWDIYDYSVKDPMLSNMLFVKISFSFD